MNNVDAYVNQITSQIKNKSVRKQVKKELEDHISDRIKYYTDAGYNEDYATENAIKKMGEPSSVAKSMKKIHNNTIYVSLAVIFLLLYIAGFVFGALRYVDFAIINLTDFEEVTTFSSVLSVLTALCGALAFRFSFKSREGALLALVGIASIVGMLISSATLIPFGYAVVSIFTDFPVAIASKEQFFNGDEIFWKIDNLFQGAVIGSYVYYILAILCVLVALLFVVMGILSLVLANENRYIKANREFLKKAKKFSIFILVLSSIAVAVTFTQAVYDEVLISLKSSNLEQCSDEYFNEAKSVYDELEIPYTKKEVEALMKKYDITEWKKAHMAIGLLNIFGDELEDYNVQLWDRDENDIFETKRFYTNVERKLSKSTERKIKKLEKGSSIEEFEKLVPFFYYSDIWVELDGDDVNTSIDICCDTSYLFGNLREGTNYSLEYKNGVLVEVKEY